ncbi:hypothetical protein DL93DRAFT_1566699 [Clavulina sp. PMI_390]|nr:hypothetical protein DL93DRAFT_1566699 [Clavulina sp. PMI_390]
MQREGGIITLARGAACVPCRKLKTKCSGSRPSCERCRRFERQCVYAGGAAKQPLRNASPKVLQARAMELQLTISKMLLSSKHNLSMISAGLRDRIDRLGTSHGQSPPPHSSIPIYICSEECKLDALASRPRSSKSSAVGFPREGDTYETERPIVERTLGSFDWVKGEELPLPMSLYLIGIFLPYRSHFNFCIPLPDFLNRLSIPASHPSSIHPCLRHACHLAACNILGGRWADIEPHFANLTRHFLNKALMLANPEHITHFLWASTLFACYLARARRVEESFAVITPASHLAMACGLLCTHNPESESGYAPNQFLLPPPVTEVEALNRIWLAHSVFITDQSLGVLTGCPGTFVCDERWRPSFEKEEMVYSWFKMKIARDEELSKVWQSDIHRNVSMAHLFRRVTAAAACISKNQVVDDETDPVSLKSFIHFHDSRIPRLSEGIGNSNPHVLFAHATLYGSSVVLHSLHAGESAQARAEMLRCSRALREICKELQGHRDARSVQSSLVPMVHMMNAIRIFAHELRRPDVQENATLSAEYCHSIEVLLDFLSDMTVLYPAWRDSPVLVKDVLTTAMESLKT